MTLPRMISSTNGVQLFRCLVCRQTSIEPMVLVRLGKKKKDRYGNEKRNPPRVICIQCVRDMAQVVQRDAQHWGD